MQVALEDAFHRMLSQRASVPSSVTRAWVRWRKPALAGLASIAVAFFSIWTAWDTTGGRNTRRALGLAVWPRSSLYVTLNGGLGIVRRGALSVVPHNPATARVIAVSTDLGVQTLAGVPPYTNGGSFRLDGTPIPAPEVAHSGLCCWSDGATDGQFNYSARTDSTLLEPIGSRPLAPNGLYRFGRDWSNPQLYFPLGAEGVYYGLAYSVRSDSFWLTRAGSGGTVIEQWSREGKQLSTPVTRQAAYLPGIAVDPKDDTLWAVRQQGVVGHASGLMRLENFDTSGRHLASLDVVWPNQLLQAAGAEFAWIAPK